MCGRTLQLAYLNAGELELDDVAAMFDALQTHVGRLLSPKSAAELPTLVMVLLEGLENWTKDKAKRIAALPLKRAVLVNRKVRFSLLLA